MAFDLSQPWAVHESVALRPEPFGALAYHFGTRRLSFLKTRTLFSVVSRLNSSATAGDACREAGVGEAELGRYSLALAALADSQMIGAREPAE